MYIDTSVLAAYYSPEAISHKVERILCEHRQANISSLTEVELFSTISRKIREGSIKHAAGDRIIAKFIDHLNGHLYSRIVIGQHHYRLARDWIGQFNTPLRSLDAIHLAIASLEELQLITADKNLAKSAAFYDVDVLLVK